MRSTSALRGNLVAFIFAAALHQADALDNLRQSLHGEDNTGRLRYDQIILATAAAGDGLAVSRSWMALTSASPRPVNWMVC